ncbi:S-4TM family putative pore-forming effector [Pseudomonas putida]
MDIKAKQNTYPNIQKIAAFKRLYSIAKKYNNGYVMLNVVMMSALTFLSIGLNSEDLSKYFGFEQHDYSTWLAVASIIVLSIDKLIIGDKIDSAREMAAKIQEKFDRGLYNLGWNSALAGSQPRAEDIIKHGEWYLNKHTDAKLRDWYAVKSNSVPHKFQILICQNSSLYWDASLRQKINYIVMIIGVIIFATALTSCLALDLSTSAMVTNLTALLGPILDYGYNTLKENKDSVSNSERLLECLDHSLNDAAQNKSDAEIFKSIEAIQDQLYVKRKSDWLIPDVFYKILRNSDENIMRQTTRQLEDRLKQP